MAVFTCVNTDPDRVAASVLSSPNRLGDQQLRDLEDSVYELAAGNNILEQAVYDAFT